jgi:hypothetical protein
MAKLSLNEVSKRLKLAVQHYRQSRKGAYHAAQTVFLMLLRSFVALVNRRRAKK